MTAAYAGSPRQSNHPPLNPAAGEKRQGVAQQTPRFPSTLRGFSHARGRHPGRDVADVPGFTASRIPAAHPSPDALRRGFAFVIEGLQPPAATIVALPPDQTILRA